MEEVDSMQEQMDNVSREMEILRKNQKEMLENRNAVIEMKNTFDGLISKVYITQEVTSEPEEITMEISKTEQQRWQME